MKTCNFSLQVILSHLLTALLVTTRCDARSTRVSAQYSVSDGIDGSELSTRTFGPRGIVEDAVIEDGGILTKLNARPTRVNQQSCKKIVEISILVPFRSLSVYTSDDNRQQILAQITNNFRSSLNSLLLREKFLTTLNRFLRSQRHDQPE